MSIYQRFHPYGVVIGFVAIAMIAVFSLWQQLLRQEQLLEQPTFLADVVLLGGWVSTWISALAIHFGYRSERHARHAQRVNCQLQQEIARRQKIESSLRESEERWQLALRGNNDGIWDWNVQTNEVFFSSRWKEMLGFADNEIANHLDEWARRVHPDDLEWVTQAIYDHFDRETPFYETEHRVLCKDGSYKWILDRGQALWDEQGNAIRMTGSHTDVTERKQAEVALRESEQKYRQLIEHLNVGFVVHGPDTRILQCNRTACEILGLSMEQLLGTAGVIPSWYFVREDGTAMPIEEYPVNRVLSTQAPLNNYVVGVRQDFHPTIWGLVSAFPEFDSHHQLTQVVVIFTDISDRRRIEAERFQAEQALRRSEVTKQAIIEAIPDLLIRMRADGKYLDFISSSDFNTVNPDQLREQVAVGDVLPDHLAQLRMRHVEQALNKGTIQIYEQEIWIADTLCYEEVRVVPLISDEVLVMVRDITGRKQAELELQAQKTFLQQVIDAVPSSIFVKDEGGKFLIVNQSAASIYGVPIEAMLGQQDQSFNPDVSQTESFVVQNQQVTQNRAAITFPDQKIYDRQGQAHWYQTTISPFMDARGQVRGIIGNAIDVSDRKRAEDDLRHQKEMFQAIVTHIPVMIALFNRSGALELVNPALEQVLGWPLEDWQQQDILAQCYPDPRYRQRVLDHMAAATGQWQDFTTQTASGQILETSWANVPLSNGHLGIGQDVSDRKRKERALRQAMEAAEAASLAKSQFLANMSHELRTPLNVILGFTQLMAHDPSLNPSQREDLQTIRRSGDHLLSLINDVLDLSKIEAGHYTVERTGIDLIALLQALQTMLAERATSKGLQLHFEIAPEVPRFIQSDAQKLRQVLLNLLSNAIKFTNHGAVTLQVIAEPCDPRPAIAHPPQGALWLQFTVTDTGVGMAPPELETIFDAFVQARAGQRSASGTGLGLTISRRLVDLLGGSITVQSAPDQGSCFTVLLPVQPCKRAEGVMEPVHHAVTGLVPGQPQWRILVVDDQAENRLLLVRLLSQLGLKVQQASNGAEAVQCWQAWRPHLIWMDIRMPYLDGYEATRQIRALEPEPVSIIIALTAQASRSDRTQALAAGCNDYISKPFREETLFLKMHEYLGLEYLYAEPEVAPAVAPLPNPNPNPSLPPRPALAAALPQDWLYALEDAAVCGNDQAIATLTTQLPPSLADLAAALIDLATHYHFEQILHWVREYLPPDGSSALSFP